MNLNDPFFCFIKRHLQDDVLALVLQRKRFESEFDFDLAIIQIESRKRSGTKLPSWNKNLRLIFPSKLSSEQSSSEQTARYKQQLLKGNSVCDLTGGLGVDTFYLSQQAQRAIYVERFAKYCQAASHNFNCMKANISVVNDDCSHFLASLNESIDTFYIDPARRGSENKRLFALTDYEPNILELLPSLFKWGKRVIVKVSPMADITEVVRQLGSTVTEIHVIAVKNECKELLFCLDKENNAEPIIICANLDYEGNVTVRFTFNKSDEEATVPTLALSVQSYLYEPNVSILKAGAYKQISAAFSINKLSQHSHLYTSDTLIPHFPGRRFVVDEVYPFHNKTIEALKKELKSGNISVRNFPLNAVELRKKLKITDGGYCYLFATTLSDNQRVIVKTRKVD